MYKCLNGWIDGDKICGWDSYKIMETVIRGGGQEGLLGGGQSCDQFCCGA